MNDTNAVDPNMVGFIAVLVFLLGVLLVKSASMARLRGDAQIGNLSSFGQERVELLWNAGRPVTTLGQPANCKPSARREDVAHEHRDHAATHRQTGGRQAGHL